MTPLPRAETQSPSPVPLPHAPEETKPAAEPSPERAPPPPPPEQPLVRAASRPKGVRRVTQPVAAPAPRTPEKATLEFRIRPYAIVVLDGRQIGQTPLAPTEVEVGAHTVRLINHALGKEVTRTVEVKAGQANVFKHNLLEEQ